MMLKTGASWKASVPMAARGTWPQISTTGTESAMQSRIGVTAFVAPGPEVTRNTPTLPARARIARRHEARALLVGGHDQLDLLVARRRARVVAEDRVVGRQDRAAAVAENGVHAFVGQDLDDHLRAGHASCRPADGSRSLSRYGRWRRSSPISLRHNALQQSLAACWCSRPMGAGEPSRGLSECDTLGPPILLQNEAGALTCVAGRLFSTRGYNIESRPSPRPTSRPDHGLRWSPPATMR